MLTFSQSSTPTAQKRLGLSLLFLALSSLKDHTGPKATRLLAMTENDLLEAFGQEREELASHHAMPETAIHQIRLLRLLLVLCDIKDDPNVVPSDGEFNEASNLHLYTSRVGINQPVRCKDSCGVREAICRSNALTRKDFEDLDFNELISNLEILPIGFKLDLVRFFPVYVNNTNSSGCFNKEFKLSTDRSPTTPSTGHRVI